LDPESRIPDPNLQHRFRSNNADVQDYRLGSVSVACEGYDYPEDPYILAGSCGLEYTLELTQQGRDKRAGSHQYAGSSYNSYTKGEILFCKRGRKHGKLLWVRIRVYLAWLRGIQGSPSVDKTIHVR
jgi:hypothetical protein